MNVEIIEFYPLERDESKEMLSGTIRILLSDIGIHILGIYVLKKKDFWFFRMPRRKGIHHETGEYVFYPYIILEDHEKHKQLLETIRERGQEFIEKRLANVENPLVFTSNPANNSIGHFSRTVKANETTFSSKERATESKTKQWMDPPKRTENFPRTKNLNK